MIDKNRLTAVVEDAIEGSGLFLVGIDVSADNRIVVEVDSREGVDIDQCVAVTRAVEAAFDRDADDYELEVGSAGITSPFKVMAQYEKNVGRRVEVLTADGRKLRGTLAAVDPGAGAFTLLVTSKVKPEGKKRPVEVEEPLTLEIAACKSVACTIDFK